MQPETKFKIKVMDRLKAEFGHHIWFTKIQQVTKRGDPDLIICIRGYFFAWELKVGSNKASPLQEHTLNLIMAAGGSARVVTPENLETCIKELKVASGNFA